VGKPDQVQLRKSAEGRPSRSGKMEPHPFRAGHRCSVAALEKNNIKVIRVRDGVTALEKIKALIPPGSEVMNGASTTLIEIGYEDLMNSQPRLERPAQGHHL